MDKKKILIGLGILAAVGIGFYFWNKSKNNVEGVSEDGSEDGLGSGLGSGSGRETTIPANISTPYESDDEPDTKPATLTTRKEKRKACGVRPLFKGKKRDLWQKCVDEGGIASFDGSDFTQFENDYIDFNGLDLDL
jgi:hypothetical protein